MLKAKLVVVGGDAKPKEVDLRLPTVIGRGRDVTLTLPHPLVSRRHTELFEKDGYLYVKDLGSLNGTYVNNRKIEAEHRLAPNQLLTLGNVTFRALYDVVGDSMVDVVRGPKVCQSDSETLESPIEKDETVHLDRFDDAHEKSEFKPAISRQHVKRVATTPDKVSFESEASEAPPSADDSEEQAKDSDSHADASCPKIETPSDIFSGDEEFLTPEKSISISALESLPPLNPSVSVTGSGLDFGGKQPHSSIEAVDLDIDGQPRPNKVGQSDVALGSFLKKLPR